MSAPEIRTWSADGLGSDSDRLLLPSQVLPAGWRGRVDADSVTLRFAEPQRCLGSALVGGGWGTARGFVNLKVDDRGPLHAGGPAALITEALRQRDLPEPAVGMMTGAAMRTLRVASALEDGHAISVLLTAGLANARRAGDPADSTVLCPPPAAAEYLEPGTINLVLGTSLALTPAAQAETLATLAEAKAAALAALGVVSPVSGAPATGTGTDATVVFSAAAGAPLRYTGKHTRFGELAARLTIDALADAVADDARVRRVG